MKSLRMGMILFLLIFSTGTVFAGGGKEEAEPVVEANRVVLEENWEFSWNFNNETVEFSVTAPTTGWVSIGFNPSSGMADASYVIGYVEAGEVFIREDYGTGRTSHASDISLGGSEDVQVVSGAEIDGITTLVFSIPRDSGDTYDTILNPGETYTVLMAYGPNGINNFTFRHRRRTSMEVVL